MRNHCFFGSSDVKRSNEVYIIEYPIQLFHWLRIDISRNLFNDKVNLLRNSNAHIFCCWQNRDINRSTLFSISLTNVWLKDE